MKRRQVLLNPGPVLVSDRVRNALTRGDICHREKEFFRIQRKVREMLVEAFTPGDAYTSVIFTGSGTSAMEAAISSALEEGKTILIINNGVYGERMAQIASIYKFNKIELVYDWKALPDIAEVEETLKTHQEVQVVALIHHETSTGLINPVEQIGELSKKYGKVFLLDSISGLGGEEIDLVRCNVDICTGSANKCIQGLPGLSFLLLRRQELERMRKIPPRALYLHVFSQWESQEKDSTPFTPSVPIFYAFEAALEELLEEGVSQRIARYKRASRLLRQGFRELGLKFFLSEELLSNTITSLYLPKGMTYQVLHDHLKDKGFVIYAGQERLKHEVFRVANMGQIFPRELEDFLGCLGAIVAGAKCKL